MTIKFGLFDKVKIKEIPIVSCSRYIRRSEILDKYLGATGIIIGIEKFNDVVLYSLIFPIPENTDESQDRVSIDLISLTEDYLEFSEITKPNINCRFLCKLKRFGLCNINECPIDNSWKVIVYNIYLPGEEIYFYGNLKTIFGVYSAAINYFKRDIKQIWDIFIRNSNTIYISNRYRSHVPYKEFLNLLTNFKVEYLIKDKNDDISLIDIYSTVNMDNVRTGGSPKIYSKSQLDSLNYCNMCILSDCTNCPYREKIK